MAVPDFNTTMQLYREWSKRGASEQEIQNAIALQQQEGGSSSGSTTSDTKLTVPDVYSQVISTSNVTAIAAPTSGQRIALLGVVAQNLSDTESQMLLKNAESGASFQWPIPKPSLADGIAIIFGVNSPLALPPGDPLVVDIAELVDHSLLILYLILDANGRPV